MQSKSTQRQLSAGGALAGAETLRTSRMLVEWHGFNCEDYMH